MTRHRRGGQAPVRADQGPVVPEREGLQALPEAVRPDRGGHPLPRQARRAREQGPRGGHRGATRGRRRGRSRTTTSRTRPVLAARAPRRRGRPDQEPGEGQEALQRLQGGESFKKVAKDLSTDPATKDQGGRLLGITKGQQESDVRRGAVQRRRRASSQGPVKTDAGLLRLRGHQDHRRRRSRPSSSPRRASASC